MSLPVLLVLAIGGAVLAVQGRTRSWHRNTVYGWAAFSGFIWTLINFRSFPLLTVAFNAFVTTFVLARIIETLRAPDPAEGVSTSEMEEAARD